MRRRDDEDQIEFLKTFMIIWANGTKQKFREKKVETKADAHAKRLEEEKASSKKE